MKVQITSDQIKKLTPGTEVRVVNHKTGMTCVLWVAEKDGEKILIDTQQYVWKIRETEGFHYEVDM